MQSGQVISTENEWVTQGFSNSAKLRDAVNLASSQATSETLHPSSFDSHRKREAAGELGDFV